MLFLRDETRPGFEVGKITTLANERFVDEPFCHNDVRQGVQDRDIRARPQSKMTVRLDMDTLHQIDFTRIDDDQLRAAAQTLLEAGGEDRMRIGRIGADDKHNIGVLHRSEILGAGGSAVGARQTEAGRRVADAGAGVHIVIAKTHTHELLDEIHLLVRATGRRDRADSVTTVSLLDALELRPCIRERLLP